MQYQVLLYRLWLRTLIMQRSSHKPPHTKLPLLPHVQVESTCSTLHGENLWRGLLLKQYHCTNGRLQQLNWQLDFQCIHLGNRTTQRNCSNMICMSSGCHTSVPTRQGGRNFNQSRGFEILGLGSPVYAELASYFGDQYGIHHCLHKFGRCLLHWISMSDIQTKETPASPITLNP